MRSYCFLSYFFLLLTLPVFAQPQTKDLEKYIENARKDWSVPGMAVAIVKDGKVVSSRGYGVLEEGGNTKVDGSTLFAIASNTKAFTASAIGILQDEGSLNMKDEVQMYLPNFELYNSYASSEAQIEDLLCHRLGLGTYSGDIIWYKSDFSALEVMERIRYVKQAYSFRAGYGYSNLMFITAGEVISKVADMPWHQFVQDRFLSPLGMKRTICSTTLLESMGNFAMPHKRFEDKNIAIPWVNWDNMGAAGSIISSSDDMAQWLLFQLANGIWKGDTILQPTTQNLLWTPHNNYVVSDKSRRTGTNFSGYGLGWNVGDFYGHRIISHGGGYDGMYSQVAMIPELNLGIVILTNSMSGIATPIRQYVFNAFLKKETRDWSAEALARSGQKSGMQKAIEKIQNARAANTTPTLPLADYTGTFETDMVGKILILAEGDQLKLGFEHAPGLSASLRHWHYDTWEIVWDQPQAWFDFGTLQFEIDNSLEVKGLVFDVPNDDIFFDELVVKKVE